MHVVRRDRAVDLTGDGAGLRDLLRHEPFALQHVLKVHVAGHVQLVGAFEHHAPVLEQAGEDPVDDGGADLALDVVTDERDARGGETVRPLRIARDEDRDGVDERDTGLERGGGVVLLCLFGAHR